jgi:cysteine desulfurase
MNSGAQIYLYFNASTPMAPEVIAAMGLVLGGPFGNPSSDHWAAGPARDSVEKARKQVARLLVCKASEVVFTSGGSEANNQGLTDIFLAGRCAHPHIVTTQVEHPAIQILAVFSKGLGPRVTYVPVDGFGRVDPDDVRNAIKRETVLISVMHANNEIGTIQPIPEISRVAREHGIPFHTDAAQTVGKIPARVDEPGVDLLSMAGHKLYGPKGIGALYIPNGAFSLNPSSTAPRAN